MAIETKVVGKGDKVLLLLGFGLRFDEPGTIWMMDRFAGEGLGSTFVSLPTEIGDYRTDIVGPCRDVESGMGEHVLLGLSLGGLTGAYLEGSKKRIFLSPFWGVNDIFQKRGMDAALAVMRALNFRKLRRHFAIKDAGHFAVAEDLKNIPEEISIETIAQMLRMQSEIPPPRSTDVVYRSRDDFIISHSAVDRRGIPIIEYDGGHMVHLVEDRDRIFDGIVGTIGNALEGG